MKRIDNRHRGFLLIAGAYNLIWGFFIYNFSSSYLIWLSEGAIADSYWIKSLAIGILLLGLGMILVAIKPLKFKWLLWIATCTKLLGALPWYLLIVEGQITKKFIFHVLMNDLIWLFPLAYISYLLYQDSRK